MILKIVYSKKNMTFRLINVDAIDSERSSNRCLATWMSPKGKNLTWTYWRNDSISELNPYRYNRVNFHYTNESGKRITQSYYCISEVINMEEMTLNDFDEMIIR